MGAPALVISVMHCVATLKQTLKYHETHLLNAPYDQPRAGVSTAAVRGHVRVFQCILMRPGENPAQNDVETVVLGHVSTLKHVTNVYRVS